MVNKVIKLLHKASSWWDSFIYFVRVKVTWIYMALFILTMLTISTIVTYFFSTPHEFEVSWKTLFFFISGLIVGCGIVFELERRK